MVVTAMLLARDRGLPLPADDFHSDV